MKDGVQVVNRSQRYAYLLWEFWKREEELFPDEILDKKGGLHKVPHAVIFVFDGSSEAVPETLEEAEFYARAIAMSRSKGYSPFVIVTKIDVVEVKLRKKYGGFGVDEKELEWKIAERIDAILDGLSKKLNVDRYFIDFVENYSHESAVKNLKLEYYGLKTLVKVIEECKRYVKSRKSSFCQVF